jgi:hypothetical protein
MIENLKFYCDYYVYLIMIGYNSFHLSKFRTPFLFILLIDLHLKILD